ncbi:MAG: hypothetical protein IIY06_02030 [Proteobacteria bacterium]|nr:hypothetical protein [Pseudomonadota bacterium]
MSKQPILPQSIAFDYEILILHHALDDSLVIDLHGFYAGLFILVKTEAQ